MLVCLQFTRVIQKIVIMSSRAAMRNSMQRQERAAKFLPVSELQENASKKLMVSLVLDIHNIYGNKHRVSGLLRSTIIQKAMVTFALQSYLTLLRSKMLLRSRSKAVEHLRIWVTIACCSFVRQSSLTRISSNPITAAIGVRSSWLSWQKSINYIQHSTASARCMTIVLQANVFRIRTMLLVSSRIWPFK